MYPSERKVIKFIVIQKKMFYLQKAMKGKRVKRVVECLEITDMAEPTGTRPKKRRRVDEHEQTTGTKKQSSIKNLLSKTSQTLEKCNNERKYKAAKRRVPGVHCHVTATGTSSLTKLSQTTLCREYDDQVIPCGAGTRKRLLDESDVDCSIDRLIAGEKPEKRFRKGLSDSLEDVFFLDSDDSLDSMSDSLLDIFSSTLDDSSAEIGIDLTLPLSDFSSNCDADDVLVSFY